MEDKSVLVLGGGVGGVVTAVELRKKLPKRHRIVLIDREPQHVFAPSLLWLMVGLRKATRISRPLERLRKKGIDTLAQLGGLSLDAVVPGIQPDTLAKLRAQAALQLKKRETHNATCQLEYWEVWEFARYSIY